MCLIRELYKKWDYTVDDLRDAVGGPDGGLSNDKVKLLMGRMQELSLSLHGIQGEFSEKGSKTVIPGIVTGKFSLPYVSMSSSSTEHIDS